MALGMNDADRMSKSIAGIVGKRLTYRRANEAKNHQAEGKALSGLEKAKGECNMTEQIIEYQASDIDAGLTLEGEAVLSLLTDKGRVAIHMRRSALESLAGRIKRELERVHALSPHR
jgi:hypothetical protein